ncbi:single-stranded-DNA-specific exonuclease RecJ [Candidatus Southlakia epibionticum]|uniref:Single-stranded-DNA-specific exonuclease RecJ n=1 Tax=Candidatus Southlakia epibionticum TaxID=3043284 RepID=A0ABY8WY16_9BACT|nr:Single-stranded-DNA-specific exonuclease RecJ [Candidatus Saccharimonadaceae bacterium ML1]
MTLFEQILAARGLSDASVRQAFLSPDYAATKYDPFLLSEMDKAVERLVLARQKQEKIVIYGDYDIDGLSATALLLDAFHSFGFQRLDAFIPNRFVEGYGMTIGAVNKVRDMGAQLIVTVDCGSLCHTEIAYAADLGIDTVVTDHHNIAPTRPPAIATVNPKYADHEYPFRDLCGAGVAFKLVQALQTRLDGLPDGYEKWLLDLVALGTVCDIVTLADENRANVYWGLEVLKKQRRTGLKALMAVSGIEPEIVNARHLGFGLGPRMNAAGRLDTAQHSLDMLTATDGIEALAASEKLEAFNVERRSIQDEIFKQACEQADGMADDRVLVVASEGWNHGVIGIVASKLVETYKKPVFIIGIRGDTATGSARSFGNFSAADAVRAADDIILRGGGHGAAAGVTLETAQIPAFRRRVNEFYDSLNLTDQVRFLQPSADVEVKDFAEITEELVEQISRMEPFGNGNPEPILKIAHAVVAGVRRMGANGQHVKIALRDASEKTLQVLAFNAPESFFREPGDEIAAWFQPNINEWNGVRTVEGRLLHVELR